ncbi:hypothetical protein [Symbiopectobacterium sp. RP]|uniref:hypothetical protein n=1 Tax=Symbiopectobacterium sp. RP TaxID=3248553 RepID=UPI003D26644A
MMKLQDPCWIDYLLPVLPLLIALPLYLCGKMIDIREKRQNKNNPLRARYAKKYQARHARKHHVK